MIFDNFICVLKVVLDVGCGTGILSLFAAKSGAKRVFAVDCADIIDYAQKVVEDNGFGSIITLIKGTVEKIELPVKHVDIIISEWMGYCLLFESMLDSVFFARDKWLKPDGLLFPDKATLYMAATNSKRVTEEVNTFWSNVYGFDMSVMKPVVLMDARTALVNPKTVSLHSAPEKNSLYISISKALSLQIISDPFKLLKIDLYTATVADLSFKTHFCLKMQSDELLWTLFTFFTVDFRKCHTPVSINTSPFMPPTHWKQTVFHLDDYITVGTGEYVYGTFRLSQNKRYKRDLEISLDLCYSGKYTDVSRHGLKYKLR